MYMDNQARTTTLTGRDTLTLSIEALRTELQMVQMREKQLREGIHALEQITGNGEVTRGEDTTQARPARSRNRGRGYPIHDGIGERTLETLQKVPGWHTANSVATLLEPTYGVRSNKGYRRLAKSCSATLSMLHKAERIKRKEGPEGTYMYAYKGRR